MHTIFRYAADNSPRNFVLSALVTFGLMSFLIKSVDMKSVTDFFGIID